MALIDCITERLRPFKLLEDYLIILAICCVLLGVGLGAVFSRPIVEPHGKETIKHGDSRDSSVKCLGSDSMNSFGVQAAAQRGIPEMIDASRRGVVPRHVLFRQLDDESVLLNLESERYFGLDATGTRMWGLVTTEPNLAVAFEKLLAEFDVEPEPLRSHLNELLGGLVENGLLQVVPADVETSPAV